MVGTPSIDYEKVIIGGTTYTANANGAWGVFEVANASFDANDPQTWYRLIYRPYEPYSTVNSTVYDFYAAISYDSGATYQINIFDGSLNLGTETALNTETSINASFTTDNTSAPKVMTYSFLVKNPPSSFVNTNTPLHDWRPYLAVSMPSLDAVSTTATLGSVSNDTVNISGAVNQAYTVSFTLTFPPLSNDFTVSYEWSWSDGTSVLDSGSYTGSGQKVVTVSLPSQASAGTYTYFMTIE